MNLKTISRIVLVSLVLFAGVSCSKEPEACFTVDKGKTAKLNEEVQFDGTCSKDAEGYEWNFGDGATSGGVTQKHKYTVEGNYTITLTVDNGSKSNSTTQSISIVK